MWPVERAERDSRWRALGVQRGYVGASVGSYAAGAVDS